MTEDQARALIEGLVWPDGPVCRHCLSPNVVRMRGPSARPGVLRCRGCRKQFTVTVGTIFESSHVPLAKWVRAIRLIGSSERKISALRLQRELGLGSYKAAWRMTHRIRIALKCDPLVWAISGRTPDRANGRACGVTVWEPVKA